MDFFGFLHLSTEQSPRVFVHVQDYMLSYYFFSPQEYKQFFSDHLKPLESILSVEEKKGLTKYAVEGDSVSKASSTVKALRRQDVSTQPQFLSTLEHKDRTASFQHNPELSTSMNSFNHSPPSDVSHSVESEDTLFSPAMGSDKIHDSTVYSSVYLNPSFNPFEMSDSGIPIDDSLKPQRKQSQIFSSSAISDNLLHKNIKIRATVPLTRKIPGFFPFSLVVIPPIFDVGLTGISESQSVETAILPVDLSKYLRETYSFSPESKIEVCGGGFTIFGLNRIESSTLQATTIVEAEKDDSSMTDAQRKEQKKREKEAKKRKEKELKRLIKKGLYVSSKSSLQISSLPTSSCDASFFSSLSFVTGSNEITYKWVLRLGQHCNGKLSSSLLPSSKLPAMVPTHDLSFPSQSKSSTSHARILTGYGSKCIAQPTLKSIFSFNVVSHPIVHLPPLPLQQSHLSSRNRRSSTVSSCSSISPIPEHSHPKYRSSKPPLPPSSITPHDMVSASSFLTLSSIVRCEEVWRRACESFDREKDQILSMEEQKEKEARRRNHQRVLKAEENEKKKLMITFLSLGEKERLERERLEKERKKKEKKEKTGKPTDPKELT
eukprot:gnl/Carplike_NY0171/2057_a2771_503.p1 GENE.gnl/Carplike_NY0171/2057_a2771_503~~gnl/Carplike_NY0171/2057_a2771_503.p1  ORF type:complete len:604 (-),score=124.39 gnl/Carplike_NY0171/2057_a2771_503:18-1829(-)